MLKKVSLLVVLTSLLAGCSLFSKEYINTFDDSAAWGVSGGVGVSAEVLNERLEFESQMPGTVLWSTAGRSDFENGTYSLDTAALSGSQEVASGLIFRADPAAGSFYYFLVSADGAYSIGGCYNNCEAQEDFIPLTSPAWITSPMVKAGFDQTNSLSVMAEGDQLQFMINGESAETFTTAELPKGDIGLLVRTFDSGAKVSFDNLIFQPLEEE